MKMFFWNPSLKKAGASVVLAFFVLSNLPVSSLYAANDQDTPSLTQSTLTERADIGMTLSGQMSPENADNTITRVKDTSTIENNTESGSMVLTGALNSGTVSSGNTMSGSTSTGSFLPPVTDYSKYKYYSGTFVRDGKTYGNSLYSDDLGFSDMKDKNVQIKSYDEYMRAPKGKQKQWALSEAPMMMSMSAPTSGLTWSWDLNGNANDTSGNGYNGTAANVTWTSDSNGQYWSFNGTNSRVQVNLAQTLSAYTVSLWAKFNSTGGEPVLFRTYAGGSIFYVQLYQNKWYVYHSGWVLVLHPTSPLPTTWVWYNVTLVFNGATVKLYIDNTEIASGSGGSLWQFTTIEVGWRGWVWYLNGDIKKVKLYNRALSSSEIQDLYNESSTATTVNNNTSSNTPLAPTNQVLANPLFKFDFADTSSQMFDSNLRLSLKNSAMTTGKNTTNEADPVILSRGEFTYDNTLMSIPGKKLPFEFKLSYKNQMYYNGPAGINWDHNYNMYLTTEANGNILYQNGRLGVFRFIKNGSTFDYNEGLRANLALSGSTYVMSYDTGEKHSFNAVQRISRIEDISGNNLNFIYSGGLLSTVTDTLGRNISYSYYDHNRLKDVIDFNGRKVGLNYFTGSTASGSIYDLQGATIDNGTGSTKAISFEYTVGGDDTTSHNITKLIDSKNQTYVVNTYDTGDRVATQKYGSGILNYAYELSGTSITKNTVTDKLGNKTEYTYNANGNQTQVKYFNEAQTGSTVYNYEYNTNGFLIKETKPRGNGFAYSYDSKGNMLEKRMKADTSVANSGSDIVTIYTYNSLGQVLTETRPNGIVVTNTYDTAGNILSKTTSGITSHSGATSTSVSNFSYIGGFLDTATDGEGNITKFQYSSGQVSKIIRGTGSVTSTGSFAYDSYGNPTSSIDGAGWTKNAVYNAFSLLSTGTTAEGVTTSYQYDQNGNKTKETRYLSGGISVSSQFFYDLLDNMTGSLVDTGSGKKLLTTFKYDENNNVIEKKVGSGATAKYVYNEFAKVKEERIIMNPSDSTKDIVTSYAYDSNGNLVSKKDPMGNISAYNYDLYDRATRETNPKGTYTSYAYNSDGSVSSKSVYNSGNTILSKSAYLYDGLGNVVKSTDYLNPASTTGGVETKIAYDRNGKKIAVTDSLGNTTRNTYDVLGRLSSTTDALGNAVNYTYDKRDLAISKSIVPSTGTGIVTTTSAYDKDGRLTSETNNLNQTKTLAYNALNQIISSKDEANNITDYELDYAGKTTKETKYLSGTSITTKYAYDERGNLISVIDPKNNETMYLYDGLNRNTDVVYADGKGLSYFYDKNSNLTSQTDPNGTVTTNSYDITNLLKTRSITTGTGVIGITSETYSYDPLGRVISGNDSNNTKLDFSYDAFGRLTSEANSGTTVGYTYDMNNNLSKIIYPDARESIYSYDTLNRVTGISFSGATIASYAYTWILNTGISYGNGKVVSQTFDELLRLKALNNGVNSYAYSYDAAGNMTSDNQKNYSYDSIYRLIGASNTQSGTTLEGFSYDKAGNRTSDGNNAYTTNTLNQYTNLSGATNATYAYDNNGNVTNNGAYSFQYDYKNRLVKVNSGATNISEYKYDVLGRRIEKKVGDEILKYTYANKNIISESRTKNGVTFKKTYINGLGTDNLIAYDNEEVNLSSDEKDELGFCNDQVLSATGRFVKYGYTGIVDRCNSLNTSGGQVVTNRYYFQKNHLGSVVGLTNSTGVLVGEYQYDVFGNTYSRTGTGTFAKITATNGNIHDNARLYTGREYDTESGLFYLRARYYDAGTGRFISRDPIGQVDDLNLYGYVKNNPMKYTDPSWKKAKQETLSDKERFEKISEYMQSGTFRNSLFKEWNTAAVDYLWIYSLQICNWDVSKAFSTINSAVRWTQEYDESESDQVIREGRVPTGLTWDYKAGEYWNKDKLQHFFKSAQISYSISISNDIDIWGAAVEILWESKEIFLDELPHLAHLKDDGYDIKDIEANRKWAQFWRYLRRYEDTTWQVLPSDILN